VQYVDRENTRDDGRVMERKTEVKREIKEEKI
jgi:hypothetical protein